MTAGLVGASAGSKAVRALRLALAILLVAGMGAWSAEDAREAPRQGTLLAAGQVELAVHQDRARACDYHPARGPWHRHKLARCFYESINPPGSWGYVHGVMTCETRSEDGRGRHLHWDPAPVDWRSRPGHSGPLQQAHEYWDGRYHHYGRRWDKGLVNNPGHFRTNIVVSFRMARAMGSWRPHWSCA